MLAAAFLLISLAPSEVHGCFVKDDREIFVWEKDCAMSNKAGRHLLDAMDAFSENFASHGHDLSNNLREVIKLQNETVQSFECPLMGKSIDACGLFKRIDADWDLIVRGYRKDALRVFNSQGANAAYLSYFLSGETESSCMSPAAACNLTLLSACKHFDEYYNSSLAICETLSPSEMSDWFEICQHVNNLTKTIQLCEEVRESKCKHASDVCVEVPGEIGLVHLTSNGYKYVDENWIISDTTNLINELNYSMCAQRCETVLERDGKPYYQLMRWFQLVFRRLKHRSVHLSWQCNSNILTKSAYFANCSALRQMQESIRDSLEALTAVAKAGHHTCVRLQCAISKSADCRNVNEDNLSACVRLMLKANQQQSPYWDHKECLDESSSALVRIGCFCNRFRSLHSGTESLYDSFAAESADFLHACHTSETDLNKNVVRRQTQGLKSAKILQMRVDVEKTDHETQPYTIFRIIAMIKLLQKRLRYYKNFGVSVTRIQKSTNQSECNQLRVHETYHIAYGNDVHKITAAVWTITEHSGIYLFRFSKKNSGYHPIEIALCQELLRFGEVSAATEGAIYSGENENEFFAALQVLVKTTQIKFGLNSRPIEKSDSFRYGDSNQASCHVMGTTPLKLSWYVGGLEIPERVVPDQIIPFAVLPLRYGNDYFEATESARRHLAGFKCSLVESGLMVADDDAMRFTLSDCEKDLFEPHIELSTIDHVVLENKRCGQWWYGNTSRHLQNCTHYITVFANASRLFDLPLDGVANYRTTYGTHEALSVINFRSTTPLADLICCATELTTDVQRCQKLDYEVKNVLTITGNTSRVYEGDSLALTCGFSGFHAKMEFAATVVHYARLNSIAAVDTFYHKAAGPYNFSCNPSKDYVLTWQRVNKRTGDYVLFGEKAIAAAYAETVSESDQLFTTEFQPSSRNLHRLKNATEEDRDTLTLHIHNATQMIQKSDLFFCSVRPACTCEGSLISSYLYSWHCNTAYAESMTESSRYVTYKLIEHPVIRPHFDDQVKDVTVSEGAAILECLPYGDPIPDITWYVNDNDFRFANQSNHTKYAIADNGNKLRISGIDDDAVNDNFACIASNRRGQNATLRFRLQHPPDPTARTKIILLIALPAAAVILALLVWGARRTRASNTHMYKDIQMSLERASDQDETSSLDSEATPAQQLQQLGYNPKKEIAKARLRIHKRIGKGQFGVVWGGRLIDTDGDEMYGIPVAIKQPRDYGDRQHYEALIAELKVMSRVPKHENVVWFYGQVTKNLFEGELYLVTERCCCSLLDYLLKEEDSLPSKANYPPSIADMLELCMGIADGMQHLAKQNIVHRDLAARNVLLTDDFVPKISDYGLSRQLKAGYYISSAAARQDAASPIAWMALELVVQPHNRKINPSVDVWSFGVVMWEIFSLGKEPYVQFNVHSDDGLASFRKYLKRGNRLKKPTNCPTELYRLMCDCWHEDPKQRPAFDSCAARINQILNNIGHPTVETSSDEEFISLSENSDDDCADRQ